jgi:hypothetical protein
MQISVNFLYKQTARKRQSVTKRSTRSKSSKTVKAHRKARKCNFRRTAVSAADPPVNLPVNQPRRKASKCVVNVQDRRPTSSLLQTGQSITVCRSPTGPRPESTRFHRRVFRGLTKFLTAFSLRLTVTMSVTYTLFKILFCDKRDLRSGDEMRSQELFS